jgi:hypothetical protein
MKPKLFEFLEYAAYALFISLICGSLIKFFCSYNAVTSGVMRMIIGFSTVIVGNLFYVKTVKWLVK